MEYEIKGKCTIDFGVKALILEDHPRYKMLNDRLRELQEDLKNLKDILEEDMGLESETFEDDLAKVELNIDINSEIEYEKIK